MEEHEPLFRITVQIHHAGTGDPVRFQDDGEPQPRGKHLAQHSLKLVTGVDYILTFEVNDIGKTVTGLGSVTVETTALDELRSMQHHNEKHDCAVFTRSFRWSVSQSAKPTPKGSRDQVLVELNYSAGFPRVVKFHMQIKLYDGQKPKRVKRATCVGGPLGAFSCRYDAKADASLRRWSFEEGTEKSDLAPLERWLLLHKKPVPEAVDRAAPKDGGGDQHDADGETGTAAQPSG
jgi:hypothetical protein